MNRLYFLAVLLIIRTNLSAQLIVTDPLIPTDNQSVTIIFDATKGNAGLKGYTGDVYAYTGVVTNFGKWLFVKETSWLDNPASCKMMRIATDKYQLIMTPSIRAFYNVPDTQKILQMAFVFRSADGAISGRDVNGADIFTDVFTQGLNVSFINPSVKFSMVNNNQKIPVKVSASVNDSIGLFQDGTKIKSVVGQLLIDTLVATGKNLHVLIAVAYSGNNSVADTISYFVHGNTMTAIPPSGVHDGINYINDTTITLELFAPYKNYIYLIGDFNSWVPDTNYLMYRNANDNNRFWITVNHLTRGKEYIFQYLIDGTIRIADPYSEKISDPSNDKYITSLIYPNLISYPDGKTTGIAGVFQTAQSPYNWQVTSFIKPDRNNLVVYELLIRDFTANKDIKTVTDTINYLKQLGVNAIELMPFSEFDGNDSWGYNPCFYFAPDKAYGTREDYKKFIDVCHQNGIAVIQDMVLDFSTGNSPLVQMYFTNGNPSSQNPWYNVSAPVGAYTFGGFDFNHDSPYTRKLVDSITSFWMTQYKIDGFRFDFAKGWTNTPGEGTPYDQPRIINLELAADHIWKENSRAYVILELFTDNSEETVLSNYGMMIWGNMNGRYAQAAMSLNSAGNTWDLSGISYKNLGWNSPGLIGYMESHDEERIMYDNETYGNSSGNYNIKDITTGLARMELNNTFFLPIPGPKMIWQFGELGYDKSINFNSRVGDKPILWDYFDNPGRKHLYNVISALIHLKEQEPIFLTNNFTINSTDAIKTYQLTAGDSIVFGIGNFDVTDKSIATVFPASGLWYEFFTGDTINLASTSFLGTLKHGEYRLYSNKVLKGTNSIPDAIKLTGADAFKAYPNPFNSLITIEGTEDIHKIELVNMQGTVIKLENGNERTINTDDLKPGIYLLIIDQKNGLRRINKMLKY